jgi:hypothetical protein
MGQAQVERKQELGLVNLECTKKCVRKPASMAVRIEGGEARTVD